jgi:hypothetical protein
MGTRVGDKKYIYDAEFKASHPVHWNALQNMYRDKRLFGREISLEFSRDDKGFKRFVEVIGPVPRNMERPSVSRFDHSKGYVFDSESSRWNFRWQPTRENGFEAVVRCGLVENTPCVTKRRCLEEYLRSLPPGSVKDLRKLAIDFEYNKIASLKRSIVNLIGTGSINAQVSSYQVFVR